MNNSEVVINIEDIYYKHHDENNKNLLGKSKLNRFYNFLERFFCCFL